MTAPQLVKLGGELLAAPAVRDGIAAALAAASGPVVLVHGGGPQATALQHRLGMTPRIVHGRRVTDEQTLEVAKLVFAGSCNTDLVAALARHGAKPVGLTGVDGALLDVTRRPPAEITVNGERQTVDFGLVGDIVGVRPDLVHTLLAAGYTPVICSLAADGQGTILNVNADTVAAEVAIAVDALRLLLLTGVPGVFRDFERREGLWTALSAAEARAAVDSGAVGGGMAPKLTACARAVDGGVGEARILAGADPAALAGALAGRPGAGTRIAA